MGHLRLADEPGSPRAVSLAGRVADLDGRLMALARRRRSAALDGFLVRLTRVANYSRLWLLTAGALFLLGGRRGRRAARRGLLAVAIAAAVANGPAKLLVGRRRPRGPAHTLIPMPRSTSFPSGHSAAAFAFATGVCAEWPELGVGLLPLASAVAYSRVHVGVHHPSDVAAGVAIGVGSGLLSPRGRGGCRRSRTLTSPT